MCYIYSVRIQTIVESRRTCSQLSLLRGNSMAKNTVSLVWDIAEPIAEQLGLVLWDVVFEKEGANYYLRVFIDKVGGVGIEDCVNMSRALDEPLDEADFIDRHYNLQVSSPGIERKLTRDFHFDCFKGEKVILKLIRPFENKREFKGVLVDYNNGDVTIALDDEKEMTAEKKEIAFVKVDDFDF